MTDKKTSDKSGAPPCGLYVRINHDPDMDQWTKVIGALSTGIKHRSGYAKNMHALEIALNDDFSRDAFEKAAAFVQVAEISGFTAIIKGSAEVAKDLGADGVIVNDASLLEGARKIMGDDAILGLECGQDISNISQDNLPFIDYVTLGEASKAPAPDLLSRALMLQLDLVCAIIGPINQDNCIAYASAGASFIDCTHYMLSHPKGHMQAIVNMLHEISTATTICHN